MTDPVIYIPDDATEQEVNDMAEWLWWQRLYQHNPDIKPPQ